MAVVTRTIAATGGADYTSIGAWWAARNFNGGADIWKGVIVDNSAYDENIDFVQAGNTLTSYGWLTADVANRHAGVWDTNKARIVYTGGNSAVFEFEADFFRLDWLQLFRPSANMANFYKGVRMTSNVTDVLIDYCIIWTDDNGARRDTDGIYAGNYSIFGTCVSNSVVYGWARSSINSDQSSTGGNRSHLLNIDHCALGFNGEAADEGPLILRQRSTGQPSNMNVYNSWMSEQISNGFDVRVNADGAGDVANLGGSNNVFRTIDILGGGANNVTWTANQTSTDDVTSAPPATAGIHITDDAYAAGTFDATPIDGPTNVLLANAVNRIGSEPDTRQDFSIDITGGVRSTSSVDIGPFQISTGTPPTTNVFVWESGAWQPADAFIWNAGAWQPADANVS